MKYLGKGDSPESIVTKQRLEETVSERIAAIPKAGVDTPGLLSSENYSKLAGIEPSANFYTHPIAHPISFITGLQAALDAKAPSVHSHTIANIENLQTTLDSKASASHVYAIAAEIDDKANASHTHLMSGVEGLEIALNDKADVSYVDTIAAELDDKANVSHTHNISNVTGLQTALDDKAKASHTHAIADTTGLQAALNGKANTSHAHAIANITNLQTALDAKAAASHGHTIADTIDLQEELDSKAEASHLHAIGDVTGLQAALDGKVGASHSHGISSVTGLQAALDGKVDDSQVLTNVPLNAKFTDTITTINSKTGAITKADIVALGIPAQDTVVDISGKADKTYVDNKVKTDVPVGAKFTDTVYSHPASHPASMITGLPTSLPANGGNADTVNGKTVGTNVPVGAVFTDTITTINGKTGAISKADITALGIPAQDTVYIHPTTHSISEISGLQTALDGKASTSHSHTIGNITGLQAALDGKVDDSQVLTNVPLNAKFTDTVTTINGKTGAIAKADIVALGIPSQDTNTTYSEITTAEIDTGTDSTLRTITARRLKYLLDKIVALFPTKVSELTNDSGYLTTVTKSYVGLGNVDNVKQMPISNGALENYREKLVITSGNAITTIDLSLGNVFKHTLVSNTTYSITNAVNGQAHSFTLIIDQTATVRTLAFPASVKWQGGEIPDMTTASKTYVLTFMTVNGGTTWLGMFGGEF